MELNTLKDRTVACFSVSAKSQNRLDVMLKWLSELKTKKWNLFAYFIELIDVLFVYFDSLLNLVTESNNLKANKIS